MKFIENFINIITKKYICFDGRAGRFEFWGFELIVLIVDIVLGLFGEVGAVLQGIFSLAILLPALGVTARRLHDVGKSGWLQLLELIPIVGSIIVLVLCIPEGQKESNQYGDPIA